MIKLCLQKQFPNHKILQTYYSLVVWNRLRGFIHIFKNRLGFVTVRMYFGCEENLLSFLFFSLKGNFKQKNLDTIIRINTKQYLKDKETSLYTILLHQIFAWQNFWILTSYALARYSLELRLTKLFGRITATNTSSNSWFPIFHTFITQT